jgi:4,5-dihydroxyphthalate decarboxylase
MQQAWFAAIPHTAILDLDEGRTMRTLNAAITTYPHTAALKDGSVAVDGYEFDFSTELDPGTDPHSVPDIVNVFRTMTRELCWDISEMGVTTALLGAKEYGVGYTPLPVFVTRRFDHASLSYNVNAVSHPKELEGNRVGMRSPNVPDVLWSFAVLEEEFGVDISKIEWVVTGDEHIVDAVVADRCTLERGANLQELVETGGVAAIMAPYRGSSPDVRPVFDDVAAASRSWFQTHGYIPIHHAIVVRTELLRADPDLAPKLLDAFVAAKQPMLDRLARGEDVLATFSNPRHVWGVQTTAELMPPDDPNPYGIESNRAALEALVRYAHAQGAISRPYEIEEIFTWT